MAFVGIATPHGGDVSPEYYRSIFIMQGNAGDRHTFLHIEVDTMIIGKARNILVQTAREQKVEIILFIDNDTLIDPQGAIIVDQAIDLGVVSGVYFDRRYPHLPQIYETAKEEHNKHSYWPVIEYPEGGLKEEDGVGAGCMAVRMDIFDKLEEYWVPVFEEASKHLEEFGDIGVYVKRLSPWFEFLDRRGEDLYFCERLRGIGIRPWVNYDVKCIHNSIVGIAEANFKWLYEQGLIRKEDPLA